MGIELGTGRKQNFTATLTYVFTLLKVVIELTGKRPFGALLPENIERLRIKFFLPFFFCFFFHECYFQAFCNCIRPTTERHVRSCKDEKN